MKYQKKFIVLLKTTFLYLNVELGRRIDFVVPYTYVQK